MNDQEFREYHERKWAELSEEVKTKAVDFLRTAFPEETKEEIRPLIANNPDHWCSAHHFFWGMSVRNMLRDAGLKDDLLPSGNWDDYYVKAIEEAVK